MMSDYDRWITRTPADWDDEPASAVDEAQGLVDALSAVLDDLCPDDVTDEAIRYHFRAVHAYARAQSRVQRRIDQAAAAYYADDGDHGDNDIQY